MPRRLQPAEFNAGPPLRFGYARPCAANGCPLGGAQSHSTVGEAREWWCWLHFDYGPQELTQITRLIRLHDDLLQAVFKTSQAFHDPHDGRDRGLKVKQYQDARNALDHAVRSKLTNLHAEREREPGED